MKVSTTPLGGLLLLLLLAAVVGLVLLEPVAGTAHRTPSTTATAFHCRSILPHSMASTTPATKRNWSSNTPGTGGVPPTQDRMLPFRGGATPKRSSSSVLSMSSLWSSSVGNNYPAVILAVNALGFVITLVAPQCHYHVDLLGTGAFAVAAGLPLLLSSSSRTALPHPQLLSAAAVILWSTKLALFLFYRVVVHKQDGRLVEILAKPLDAAKFWFVSALWGVVCSLPHFLATTTSATATSIVKQPSSSLFSITSTTLGLGLFAVGWCIETLADYHKWQFKQHSNPGQFCNVGLWSVSQHPNWFGNLLVWMGIFILNAPALLGGTPAAMASRTLGATKGNSTYSILAILQKVGDRLWRSRRLFAAMLGPLFMWTLFDAQATGKILNEARLATLARYGYGVDPVFTNYVDTTPLVVPQLWK